MLENLRYYLKKFINWIKCKVTNPCLSCEVRGRCCYFSCWIDEEEFKKNRKILYFGDRPEEEVFGDGKAFNIILENHPCKYLDYTYKVYDEEGKVIECKTKMEAINLCVKEGYDISKIKDPTFLCKVYEDRFLYNKHCHKIKDSIANYCLPKECAFVKYNKKYQKKYPKITLEEAIKRGMGFAGQKTYELMNSSPHDKIVLY